MREIPARRLLARLRRAPLVAAAAALDGIAAGLVLGAAPPDDAWRWAAAALHGLAAVAMLGLGRGSERSRAWLSACAVLVLPCLGTLVAAVVLLTRGEGTLARLVPRSKPRSPKPGARWARHVLLEIAPCDGLAVRDHELRRDALATLMRRGDEDAMASLQWAIAHLDADGALLAALALDEIASRRLRSSRARERTTALALP